MAITCFWEFQNSKSTAYSPFFPFFSRKSMLDNRLKFEEQVEMIARLWIPRQTVDYKRRWSKYTELFRMIALKRPCVPNTGSLSREIVFERLAPVTDVERVSRSQRWSSKDFLGERCWKKSRFRSIWLTTVENLTKWSKIQRTIDFASILSSTERRILVRLAIERCNWYTR